MGKIKYPLFVLLLVLFPVAIVSLSGNLVIRLGETYTYHFNDSQVVDSLYTSVSAGEFSDAISEWWNPLGKETTFQVFESNGEYQDPLFSEKDGQVMVRARSIANWALAGGTLALAVAVLLYVVLYRKRCITGLRRTGYGIASLTVIGLLLANVLLRRGAVRMALYDQWIGISLRKGSTLRILLGTPFYKTFLLFSTILTVALLIAFCYVNFSLTRKKRLFQGNW